LLTRAAAEIRDLHSKHYTYFSLSTGLVPITIGGRTISPITGEIGPVIGAQTNPWTHNAIPTVQSFGALPRRATDPDLVITDPANYLYLQVRYLWEIVC